MLIFEVQIGQFELLRFETVTKQAVQAFRFALEPC